MDNKKVEELGRLKLDFSSVTCLPTEIRQLLESDWKNPAVLDFFLEQSEVCRVLYKNPADFEMLEVAYFGKSLRGQVVSNGIDEWLRKSLSGQALRDRLKVVSAWMASLVQSQNGHKVTILDLGAGPGPYAFEALKGLSLASIHWRCADIDKLALETGAKRARRLGLSDVVIFEQLDFLSSKGYPTDECQKADFALMIGILCGMSPEQAVGALQKIRPHFRSGAEIMAATLLDKAFQEDPLAFRIFCNVLGWQLRPKSLLEVKEVFSAAGYRIKQVFSERDDGKGQYAIVHAVM